MKRRSLFKYFRQSEWAESFLDGEMFFNSLSYFRDYADANVRGDQNEGTLIYQPPGGLVGYNHTQRKPFVLPNHTFTTTAKTDEIFVLCASQVFTEVLRTRFTATACVEILGIEKLCNRIREALPTGTTFYNRCVAYCKPTDEPMERWALPDRIATSKLDTYAWQSEYRFVFSLTDALAFEKVSGQLIADTATRPPTARNHPTYLLQVGSLRNFCKLREWSPVNQK